MTDQELKEFAQKRIEILKGRLQSNPNDYVLRERLDIYEDMLKESFK